MTNDKRAGTPGALLYLYMMMKEELRKTIQIKSPGVRTFCCVICFYCVQQTSDLCTLINTRFLFNIQYLTSKMSSSSTTTTSTPSTTPTLAHGDRQCGICKWFDKSKGFGFVQGLTDNNDYFTHHTQLSRPPTSSEYTPSVAFTAPSTAPTFEENAFRFLMAGEYVEFTVDHGDEGDKGDKGDEGDGSSITNTTHTAPSEKRVLAVCVTGIQGGPCCSKADSINLLLANHIITIPLNLTHRPLYAFVCGSHGSRRPYRPAARHARLPCWTLTLVTTIGTTTIATDLRQ